MQTTNLPPTPHSWIEVSESALIENVKAFERLIGNERYLMAVVKANAYGHGLLEVSKVIEKSDERGKIWLGVFHCSEARHLREHGVKAPILVLGPTNEEDYQWAATKGIRLTLGGVEAVQALLKAEVEGLRVHIKLETGTNRQGIGEEALHLLSPLTKKQGVMIEGLYTHYADIEDTTDHVFAEGQLNRFKDLVRTLKQMGIDPPIKHTSCTAAALLFPDTYFNLARAGIGIYGLWPSKETFVSFQHLGRETVALRPAMTWKTRIAMVKRLEAGAYVGYGRTYRTGRESRIAVLPVGYANGYARGLSNKAHVLIDGQRAPIRGRISMNMCMADVTDIETAKVGAEVVLLGEQKGDIIPAELFADWLDTINYEVVTRAEPYAARKLVR